MSYDTVIFVNVPEKYFFHVKILRFVRMFIVELSVKAVKLESI